jgi:hypothetical protein
MYYTIDTNENSQSSSQEETEEDDNSSIASSSSGDESTHSSIIDMIYYEDEDFANQDKIDRNYYIGSYELFINENGKKQMLLGTVVSNKTFFKFPYPHIQKYVELYNIHYKHNKRVDIMKLYIVDEEYIVVLKTFWIRIIQRNWRRVYNQRLRVIQQRMNPTEQFHFQTRGRYTESLKTLRGMLYGV